MRHLLAVLCALFLLAACDATAVSTPQPTPTLDITPLPTRTASVTPTATAEPTQAPTATPIVCATPVLVYVTFGVYEVDADNAIIGGVPGVRLLFSPIYHAGETDRMLTVTSGWTGVALARFPPGEWALVGEWWPAGWQTVITAAGDGYPTSLFASPDDNPVMTYYVRRVGATPTRTLASPTVMVTRTVTP